MSAPTTGLPAVDVIVPLRDERERLPAFLEMLAAQSLQPVRVVVADGMSTDGSRAYLAEASRRMPSLVVVDNPQRVVPTALNACLARVESPIVARMDLHADYAPDYLAAVVTALAAHPEVDGVGGMMRTEGRGSWGRAIASTLRRPFGLGGARHRVEGRPGPIGHVFSGCYRTDRLRSIDGWDATFLANEDFEADTRLREAGGELWLVPEARSVWYVRESPTALARQMWRYGYFKALTLRRHPGSLQVRQLAPPALVLLLGTALATRPRAGVLLLAGYAGAAGTLGARAAAEDDASPLRGAVVPVIVHLSWGAGLLAGTARFLRSGGRRR